MRTGRGARLACALLAAGGLVTPVLAGPRGAVGRGPHPDPVAAAAHPAPTRAPQDGDRRARWRAAAEWEADRADRGPDVPAPPLPEVLRAALEGPEPEDPGAREDRALWRVWLGRSEGPVAPTADDDLDAGPDAAPDAAQDAGAWPALRARLRAEHLAPGPERARALVRVLDGLPPAGDSEARAPEEGVWLSRAYEAFLLEEGAFRGETALALARAMHRRADAIWSVFCLEGAARRTGHHAEGLAALDAQVARARERAARVDLVGRRALARAGAGDDAGSRADLGRLLVLGGTDAYQMLGRRALVEGRRAEARRLFRVLVERSRPLDPDRGVRLPASPEGPESPPWALRGWGTALLPPR